MQRGGSATARRGGDQTIADLANRFDIRPSARISARKWKTQLLENAAVAFDGASAKQDEGPDLRALHAKIGQLALENDCFSKAMIDREHALSLVRQAEVLQLSRNSLYYAYHCDGT